MGEPGTFISGMWPDKELNIRSSRIPGQNIRKDVGKGNHKVLRKDGPDNYISGSLPDKKHNFLSVLLWPIKQKWFAMIFKLRKKNAMFNFVLL